LTWRRGVRERSKLLLQINHLQRLPANVPQCDRAIPFSNEETRIPSWSHEIEACRTGKAKYLKDCFIKQGRDPDKDFLDDLRLFSNIQFSNRVKACMHELPHPSKSTRKWF